MRALSIRPPWSLVVADGRKTIENRPRRTNLRERILIHSGITYNEDADSVHHNDRRSSVVPR